ncbi:hypothetical protein L596_001455 [Steinernema carpocapsae]|uniref:Uncharacterized protein n=1 Tax=Steinernema carpocapsae TaxID=34508 RepID=A0A4U8ULM2_STECR|nr:hypothetical protein L596_001455 [Steinernema carpocapsae]
MIPFRPMKRYWEFPNHMEAVQNTYFGPNPFVPDIPFMPEGYQYMGQLSLMIKDHLSEEEWKDLKERCLQADRKWDDYKERVLKPRWKKLCKSINSYRNIQIRRGVVEPELTQRLKDHELVLEQKYNRKDNMKAAKNEQKKSQEKWEMGRQAIAENRPITLQTYIRRHEPLIPVSQKLPERSTSQRNVMRTDGGMPIMDSEAMEEFFKKEVEKDAEWPSNGYYINWTAVLKKAYDA